MSFAQRQYDHYIITNFYDGTISFKEYLKHRFFFNMYFFDQKTIKQTYDYEKFKFCPTTPYSDRMRKS